MITVQAEILFRVERREDADRVLTAIADLVIPEHDGSLGATVRANPPDIQPGPVGTWVHPHMEGA